MVTVGELAEWAGGSVVGSADRAIAGIADLSTAGPRDVSFFTHARYGAQYAATQAGCVLVGTPRPAPHPDCSLIVCGDPYLALAKVASRLYARPAPAPTRHPAAFIDPQARVAASAHVGPGAVIEAGAQIGERVHVGAQAFVGTHSRIGADTVLYAGAKVMAGCRVGERCVLHAGCVIGSDGFGFATERSTGIHHKIPQVGDVCIEDDVEIGANTTIDRATFGTTRIGAGSKIDNLVQVGHNVQLGAGCIVVSQSGIAGSTTLGRGVVVGAQGGLAGHLHITDRVMLAARAGVMRDVETPGVYSGLFGVAPHRDTLKVISAQAKLPELLRRVRQLESERDGGNAQHRER